MRIRMFSVTIAIIVSVSGVAVLAQERVDNPFRRAKVGDYVTYKQTTMFLGKDIEITIKETVSAKTDKELTLRTTATVKGTNLPSHAARVDLTRPYDLVAAVMQADLKSKFEKTGEGKEKIKVGGKTYECSWLAGKVIGDDGKHSRTVKIWFSTSVPLTGRVKVETESSFGEVTKMELTGWGSAK